MKWRHETTGARLEYSIRSFYYMGAKLYNDLPLCYDWFDNLLMDNF